MVRDVKIGVGELEFHLVHLPSFKDSANWQNTYHPILPFCFFKISVPQSALKVFILNKKGLIEKPETLGEHLRNRRLNLGLRQEDVAVQLGKIREVYDRWERAERWPSVSEWPAILSFLGYYPLSAETAADIAVKARRYQGMDQKRLAKTVGVLPERLRRWEDGTEVPSSNELDRLRSLISLLDGA